MTRQETANRPMRALAQLAGADPHGGLGLPETAMGGPTLDGNPMPPPAALPGARMIDYGNGGFGQTIPNSGGVPPVALPGPRLTDPIAPAPTPQALPGPRFDGPGNFGVPGPAAPAPPVRGAYRGAGMNFGKGRQAHPHPARVYAPQGQGTDAMGALGLLSRGG